MSCGYLGVLLAGSSLPSVTLWCGDPQARLWRCIYHVPIPKCSAGFDIPDISFSDRHKYILEEGLVYRTFLEN